MPRRKTLKMSTPEEIRRAISRIAGMVLNGEIEPKDANTLIYACNSALSAVRTDEYKKKTEELEIAYLDLKERYEKEHNGR